MESPGSKRFQVIAWFSIRDRRKNRILARLSSALVDNQLVTSDTGLNPLQTSANRAHWWDYRVSKKTMPIETTLYHNPRCSKSRAALQLLQNHVLQNQGASIDVVDYQKTPPDAATLKKILNLLDLNALELMRRGEAQFKALQSEIENCDEDGRIDLMVQYPILMERPIVVTKEGAAIGRPIDNIIELLDQAPAQ